MRHNIWLALGLGLVISAGVSAIGGLGDAESSREIAKVLAASALVGLVGGVLFFILFPFEKRVDRTAPRNRKLRWVYVILAGVWMFLHGPIRMWASASGLGDPWVLGVAPSLFAGLAVAFASALTYGFRPLTAGANGAGFTILTEMIQPWLPNYTLDPWDVAAGLVGAGFAVPLLMRWPVAVHTESAPALRTEGRTGTHAA